MRTEAKKSPRHPRRRVRRGGFTLVELCLGLLTTALVTGALAAFTISTAKGWEATTGTQSASLSSAAATLRIQQIVRNARLTGKYNAGALDGSSSAAVVLWLDDTNADGAIETNECALLEYDPSTRSLLYRTVPSTGSTASMTYDTFANGSSVIADMHSAASKTQPVANNLDGAMFYSTPGDGSTDRPMLEFTLKFQRRQDSTDNSSEAIGESLVGYGVATVRTPLQRPNP